VKSVLITGGTGTFGRAFAKECLQTGVERIVIYSRDEQKQEDMARELAGFDQLKTLRFFIGDVRDENRLRMAMRGIDTVVHAAALKIVPACEYNPIEAVSTNIVGAEHVIRSAIDNGVRNVVALSTDKAVEPVNLYGATKLTAERLFIAANHLSGSPGKPDATRFSIVRYGNVAGSRGSVIPLFKRMHANGETLPITDPRMTRFWISIGDAVLFVMRALNDMRGGEIFIPKMRSFRVADLADAIDPVDQYSLQGVPIASDRKVIGIRPGEKLHETLITSHDTPRLYDDALGRQFIIFPEWISINGKLSDFTYSSDTNPDWLSTDEIRKMI